MPLVDFTEDEFQHARLGLDARVVMLLKLGEEDSALQAHGAYLKCHGYLNWDFFVDHYTKREGKENGRAVTHHQA